MGSTGSGSFSDYSNYKSSNPKQGGDSGEDKCGKAFSSTLEEVQTCDFYSNHANVPTINTKVKVVFLHPRLAIVDFNNCCIGYLPTKYNYLRFCIEDNFTFAGIVSNSSLTPLPTIAVDIFPI